MAYRVGFPGWKWVARSGGRVSFRVIAMRDEEAGVYVAKSIDLPGLVAEAETLDELRSEVISSAHELLTLALNGHPPAHAKTDIRFTDSVPCLA